MANSKPKKAAPQAKHKTKLASSQFDKRDRLANRVPGRQTTERARVPLVGQVASLAKSTAKLLDDRIGFRLPILIAGILLAKGRCTVACWLRAAGVKGDWDRFYDLLQSIGKKYQRPDVATALPHYESIRLSSRSTDYPGCR